MNHCYFSRTTRHKFNQWNSNKMQKTDLIVSTISSHYFKPHFVMLLSHKDINEWKHFHSIEINVYLYVFILFHHLSFNFDLISQFLSIFLEFDILGCF